MGSGPVTSSPFVGDGNLMVRSEHAGTMMHMVIHAFSTVLLHFYVHPSVYGAVLTDLHGGVIAASQTVPSPKLVAALNMHEPHFGMFVSFSLFTGGCPGAPARAQPGQGP